jgi:hypothetical protein
MTSTPVTILLKRTGQASDRPNDSILSGGEMALAFGAADPGMYYKDSAGNIRKIGGAQYATTAPNSSPVGSTGNSVGELWAEAAGNTILSVWTGASWQGVGAAFATNATTAQSAVSAGTATLASGAITASGAATADTCLLASGAILASGSVGAIIASGAVGATIASGAVPGSEIVTIVATTLPASVVTGGLVYQTSAGAQPSGLYVGTAAGWAKT